MKTNFLLIMLVALVLSSCSNQGSKRIEGAWNLVAAKWVTGSQVLHYPGDYKGTQMKMWTNGHFSFVGWLTADTVPKDSYGCGSYTLENTLYNETIVYHSYKDYIGQTVKMVIEFHGDTLVQTWPLDKTGKIDPRNYNEEKYIKLK